MLANSGNANAYTGEIGRRDAGELTGEAARILGIAPELVVPLSTGVIGAHLPSLAVLDWGIDRQSIIGGGSVYPFVQNLLLSARNEGLGGVMTTFLARQEEAARALLHMPSDVGLAAVVALGVPEKLPTRLTRRPVDEFTTIDTFDGAPFRE